jgi:hypothetical protein
LGKQAQPTEGANSHARSGFVLLILFSRLERRLLHKRVHRRSKQAARKAACESLRYQGQGERHTGIELDRYSFYS